jgi:hypothetical protein
MNLDELALDLEYNGLITHARVCVAAQKVINAADDFCNWTELNVDRGTLEESLVSAIREYHSIAQAKY